MRRYIGIAKDKDSCINFFFYNRFIKIFITPKYKVRYIWHGKKIFDYMFNDIYPDIRAFSFKWFFGLKLN